MLPVTTVPDRVQKGALSVHPIIICSTKFAEVSIGLNCLCKLSLLSNFDTRYHAHTKKQNLLD